MYQYTHTHALWVFPHLAALEIIGKMISFAKGKFSWGRVRNLSHATLGHALWKQRCGAWEQGTARPIIHFFQTGLLRKEAKGLIKIVTGYINFTF